MMKKLAYALMLSFGVASVHAAEIIEVTDVTPVASSDLIDITPAAPEKQAGALAWIKEHKVLTAAIVVALVGGAVAGTAYFCPNVREKSVNALSRAKDGVVSATQTSWTFCCENKKYTIPAAVVTLLVTSLTTYDLCKDSQASYIKSFFNRLFGKQEEVAHDVA